MVTPSKTLRGMRLDKRLTQEEVAEKMRISQSQYSLIERGKKPADLDEAMKTVNTMRKRSDRTGGGVNRAGREKD